MMNSTVWTMSDVTPAERFAYWREAVSQTYLPLEPECAESIAFDGSILSLTARTLEVSMVRSAAHLIRRTREGVARRNNGAFFANLLVAGEAWVEQGGRRVRAGAGDVLLVDTDLPFGIGFEQSCDLVCVSLPGERLRARLRRVAREPVLVVRGQSPGRMAAAYVRSLAELDDGLDLVDDLAADQLSALLTRAVIGAVDEPRLMRHMEDLATRALSLIVEEIGNPQLSAKFICRELEVSRSRLFACLAERGVTLAAHIREQRLHQSLCQIRDPRHAPTPLSEIARRWGFSDGSAFSRVFSRRYGAPPGAFRPRA